MWSKRRRPHLIQMFLPFQRADFTPFGNLPSYYYTTMLTNCHYTIRGKVSTIWDTWWFWLASIPDSIWFEVARCVATSACPNLIIANNVKQFRGMLTDEEGWETIVAWLIWCWKEFSGIYWYTERWYQWDINDAHNTTNV